MPMQSCTYLKREGLAEFGLLSNGDGMDGPSRLAGDIPLPKDLKSALDDRPRVGAIDFQRSFALLGLAHPAEGGARRMP